ncbi:acyl-CoA thioesterase [Mycolicibacter hiberniae]|uniref:Acyl-CoA thioesterase II n=1 Tax=Mycolicibacter hiberniae TaxID=29314 RepID=A0A7I7X8Y5_9MYCO|nr:acyl-CoA thioesterase domain-containing protein [Mycolicibacter hiberniae]MCV7088266.1 thioesterase family protein [Mycolicibacter hiberniae]BBZ25121.1 acyl-CoA thioesterase II [Mycolicibacter hiberniae]
MSLPDSAVRRGRPLVGQEELVQTPAPEVAARPDFRGPLLGSGSPLEHATLEALDRLQAVMALHPVGTDRFRADNEADRFGRIFGGQLIGQAMAAAAATAPELTAHSIHASFLRPGDSAVPLDIAVDRTRDGRSMSARQVRVEQGGKTLMVATVSFDTSLDSAATDPTPPSGTEPESLPLLQHWVTQASPSQALWGSAWIKRPPPVEIRTDQAPVFLSGAQAPGPSAHWMRLPRPVDGDAQLQAVLLAYASDYLLVDAAFRAHPQPLDVATHLGLTLDHTVWIHRPVHFQRWHLYTQHTVATSGHRALVHGTIVDSTGRHVASTAQEVLIRQRIAPAGSG